jgi:hypothetical protein
MGPVTLLEISSASRTKRPLSASNELTVLFPLPIPPVIPNTNII